MLNVLFLCGKARQRSPTAADIAMELGDLEADFAGLSKDADVVLGREQIDWADVIVVMEPRQKARLNRQFRPVLRGKRVVCFGIPDRYAYGDPALAARLRPLIARLAERR